MKKVRLLLPALAVVFGIAGALATNASSNSMDPIDVTNDNTDPCEQIGTCTPGGQISCAVNAEETALYREDDCTTLVAINGDFD